MYRSRWSKQESPCFSCGECQIGKYDDEVIDRVIHLAEATAQCILYPYTTEWYADRIFWLLKGTPVARQFSLDELEEMRGPQLHNLLEHVFGERA